MMLSKIAPRALSKAKALPTAVRATVACHYSSLTDADEMADPRNYGYRVVLHKGQRHASTWSMPSEVRSPPLDEYSLIMSARTSLAQEELEDPDWETLQAQMDWDIAVAQDMSPPHFEALKEDPYIEDYDDWMSRCCRHDVDHVSIHHCDVDLTQDDE